MSDRLDYIFPWTVAAFLAVAGIAHLIGEGDVLMLVGAIGWAHLGRIKYREHKDRSAR